MTRQLTSAERVTLGDEIARADRYAAEHDAPEVAQHADAMRARLTADDAARPLRSRIEAERARRAAACWFCGEPQHGMTVGQLLEIIYHGEALSLEIEPERIEAQRDDAATTGGRS